MHARCPTPAVLWAVLELVFSMTDADSSWFMLLFIARLAACARAIASFSGRSSNGRAARVPYHRLSLTIASLSIPAARSIYYHHPLWRGTHPTLIFILFFLSRPLVATITSCARGDGSRYIHNRIVPRFFSPPRRAQPTEFNTCVFKLEVKNPSDPADVPNPMPKGTSYAAGPRRTMNVFRYVHVFDPSWVV